MDVGFIGLGHMGAQMARNLLKAGHHLIVYNRTRSKAETDPAVEGVVFGDRGALSALRRDAIHISMSTISVALSDHLTEAHGKAGQGYVAAPVFGRPEAATAAKLFIIAAGAD